VFNGGMTDPTDTGQDVPHVASATRDVAAAAATIFELIADPSRQPEWDGMDNLVTAAPGQRVRAVGDVFVMTIHLGTDRTNRVVEFEEGRRIAWRPSEPGKAEPGHLWRWELEPVADGVTRVTHTYDWSDLTDENRMGRARRTTSERLMVSIDRLAELAERG
jgi:uncharacterized protein YndB with AHSA1/START domain